MKFKTTKEAGEYWHTHRTSEGLVISVRPPINGTRLSVAEAEAALFEALSIIRHVGYISCNEGENLKAADIWLRRYYPSYADSSGLILP